MRGEDISALGQKQTLAVQHLMPAKSHKRTYSQKRKAAIWAAHKITSVRSMHIELPHRHHKVMRLVVSALNHNAHKAKRL